MAQHASNKLSWATAVACDLIASWRHLQEHQQEQDHHLVQRPCPQAYSSQAQAPASWAELAQAWAAPASHTTGMIKWVLC